MTFTVEMVFVKETTGTIVYGNKAQGAAISSLYITKGAIASPFPAAITVTVKSQS